MPEIEVSEKRLDFLEILVEESDDFERIKEAKFYL